MRQFIFADPAKCTGCGICELVCSGFREGKFGRSLARICVVRTTPLIDMVSACRFCHDAPCVKACNLGALRQDEASGILSVDERLCDGCARCVSACPYGAIFIHPIKKVSFACDLCSNEPRCVPRCPTKALDLATEDKASELTEAALKSLHYEEFERVLVK